MEGERMVDVVLIDPKVADCDREVEPKENLHLAELESYLRLQSHKTCMIDARNRQMSPREVAEEVAQLGPLCVFTWVMYRSLEYCLAFFDELSRHYHEKLERPVFLAGGYAATFSTIQLLKNTSPQALDAILLGEAEETLDEIVTCVRKGQNWRQMPGLVYRDQEGNIRWTQRRKLSPDIDKFPMPLRRGTHFSSDEWVEIRGSRGCYANCSFCNVGPFFGTADGPKWRGHSPSRILEEMKCLYEKGARRFYFVDDQFFGPGKEGMERVRQLTLLLFNSGLDIEWQIFCRVDNVDAQIFSLMRRAGLSIVNMGIEGGSQTQLDRMNKRQTVSQIIQAIEVVRQMGITVVPSFIMFDPYVTLSEIEANIDLIERLGFITYLGPSCTMPFPGTPLTERISAEGLLNIQHPIIAGFLPDVQMMNPEADLLRTVWMSWRPWVDGSFAGLETELVRFAYAYQLSVNSHMQRDFGFLVHQLASHLKALEADFVRQCIHCIRHGSSLEGLFALRSQYSNAISSIALAVPRIRQPNIVGERR